MFIATISFDHSAKLNTSLVATGPDLIYDQDLNKHLEAARQKIYNLSFWLHFIFFLLLLAVILRAINFRVCYLMSEHFDNVYITEEFEVYDELQSQIMGVRVLPLNSCEEIKYVKVESLLIYFLHNFYFSCLDNVPEASARRAESNVSLWIFSGHHWNSALLHLLCGLQSLQHVGLDVPSW